MTKIEYNNEEKIRKNEDFTNFAPESHYPAMINCNVKHCK